MTKQFVVGAAQRNIVPSPELVNNTLHRQMSVRFDELGSPLWVKSLALQFGEESALLVEIDTVNLRTEHVNLLRSLIAKLTGIPERKIVLTASHSHSTPFMEPLSGTHRYFDFVRERLLESVEEAWAQRRPAQVGYGRTSVVGASFNQRVPLANGGVEFTRDFRKGLASGRPIDPRLHLLRFDDEHGQPIAGWISFAAHPACVIFDTPISAEWPGYLCDKLQETVAEGAPVLFSLAACGDVNCIPMFGAERETRELGLRMAEIAAPVFQGIETHRLSRLSVRSRELDLPLDRVPDVKTLDAEIAEVQKFLEELERNPEVEWVLGVNCKKDWSVEKKRAYAAPFIEWDEDVKRALREGEALPTTWPSPLTALLLDDLGMVFYPGEPLVELGLSLAARSPLTNTVLISHGNGSQSTYLGTDADRRRGGYEMYTVTHSGRLTKERRPLPYALGAGEAMLTAALSLLHDS